MRQIPIPLVFWEYNFLYWKMNFYTHIILEKSKNQTSLTYLDNRPSVCALITKLTTKITNINMAKIGLTLNQPYLDSVFSFSVIHRHRLILKSTHLFIRPNRIYYNNKGWNNAPFFSLQLMIFFQSFSLSTSNFSFKKI